MKPRNSIYIGGPPLDPPDEPLMIKCTYCQVAYHSRAWRDHRGECPNCHKPYAGQPSED